MQTVRVYWNLHRNVYSVQDAKTRRVIGHATAVLLTDARFTVSQAGRERVLREGRKNVHAFVVGQLCAADWLEQPPMWSDAASTCMTYMDEYGHRVTYNPRKYTSFVTLDALREAHAVHGADVVSCDRYTPALGKPVPVMNATGLYGDGERYLYLEELYSDSTIGDAA